MRYCLAFLGAAMLVSGSARAQSGFYLPSSTPSYGQDEFRAADGTTCRTTMDGTKRMEMGVFGTHGQSESNYGLPGYVATTAPRGNAGVYGKFTMSLDSPGKRIDCTKLYELEMERRRLEVEIMKRSISSADRELDAPKVRDARQRPQEQRPQDGKPARRRNEGPPL